MSDLTSAERRKLEKLLQMGDGYVLNFSNKTLDEFVTESINRSIYDPRYSYGSGSKANQIRGFWKVEANHVVGKLMADLLEYAAETGVIIKGTEWYGECQTIVQRLKKAGPVTDLDALAALGDDKNFDIIAAAIKHAIENDQPEAGLDRLHTYVTKYFRSLCTVHGIAVPPDKPLHSLAGEYIRKIKELGYIESEMTLRILKTSISIFEAFNDVRNSRSLAHDNLILNYDEALLIFNNVASSVRFLRRIEERIAQAKAANNPPDDDDIPF